MNKFLSHSFTFRLERAGERALVGIIRALKEEIALPFMLHLTKNMLTHGGFLFKKILRIAFISKNIGL